MRQVLLSLLFAFSLALSACDTAEERAEVHFENAVEFYTVGDFSRAAVELRNVFKLVNAHREGRLLFAEIEERQGKIAAAYGHMRILTEVNPDDYDAQRSAARLSTEFGDWNLAKRHARAARALAGSRSKDPILRASELAIAYQEAKQPYDPDAQKRIAADATALLVDNPDLMILYQIEVDHHVQLKEWVDALESIDFALERHPMVKQFYFIRLGVLENLGETDATERQLRDMVTRFEDDDSIGRLLLRWYMSQNRIADAESYLRQEVIRRGHLAEPQMMLVGFIQQTSGPEAALEEMERVLAELPEDSPDYALYRAAKAGLDFDLGRKEIAIQNVEQILSGAEVSDQTRRIKIILARMYNQTDREAGAKALIDEVLTEDPTEVEALQMQAQWLINEDHPDDALLELRRALDQSPQNYRTLTLLAQAHDRAGSRDLSGDMLALAAEASGYAPLPTIRFADFLVLDGRNMAAESILITSLRLNSGNTFLLQRLGEIYLRTEDWGRLDGVIEALNENGGALTAGDLVGRMLAAQDRLEEQEAFLAKLAEEDVGNTQIVATVVRLRLARGDREGAMEFLQTRLTESPDDPELRFVAARVFATTGERDRARDELRSLIAEDPGSERYWITLYNLTRQQEGAEDAFGILDEAVAAVPDSRRLAWIRAGELERLGKIDEAIALYEDLYDTNTDSLIVANNLASLLASHRDDPDSLTRAYAIARRLRGTDVPAFQDTYGWIMTLRDKADIGLTYLEPAAKGLPEDPTVRYHLAYAYAQVGQDDAALEAYREAQRLLEYHGLPQPYAEEVTGEIARLSAPPDDVYFEDPDTSPPVDPVDPADPAATAPALDN